MKTNLKSLRLSVLILAGLMGMSLCFSGCSPMRAKRINVDLVALAKLQAQAEKDKVDAEAKRQAEEAKRIADANAAAGQPAGTAADSSLGEQPAVEPGVNGDANDGVDGNTASTNKVDPIYDPAFDKARVLGPLTEADTAFATAAQESFTTTFINDGSMTAEQLASAAVNFDPALGYSIFGMSVNKSLESAATDGQPAIYSVDVELALKSIDDASGLERSNQFELNFSLQQNGRVVALNPNYVDVLNPEGGDAEAVENVVIYSVCGSDDCSILDMYVGIRATDESAQTEIPEQIAAFKFQNNTDGTMKLIASTVGVDNVQSMNDVFVRYALLKSAKDEQAAALTGLDSEDSESADEATTESATATDAIVETENTDTEDTTVEGGAGIEPAETTTPTEEATLPAPTTEGDAATTAEEPAADQT